MPLSAPVTAMAIESAAGKYGRVAVAAMQGWRSSFEDAHFFDADAGRFAVYDGHAGDEVAAFCAERLHLHAAAAESGASGPPMEEALQQTFIRCDAELRNNLHAESEGGATATFAVVRADPLVEGAYTVTVANSGDSRAILWRRDGGSIEATRDHRPDDPAERARIEAAGGFVDDVAQPARVDGLLACSRAFGAFQYKEQNLDPGSQKISCVPDVYQWQARAGDWLLIGCDGVWDTLSNDAVVAAVCGAEDTSSLGTILSGALQLCVQNDAEDNMTLMAIELGPPKAVEARSVSMLPGGFLQAKDACVKEQYVAFSLRYGYDLQKETPQPKPQTENSYRPRFVRSVAKFSKAPTVVPGPRFSGLPVPPVAVAGSSMLQAVCDDVVAKDEESIVALLDGVPGGGQSTQAEEDQPWWFSLIPCCFRRK